MKETNSRKGYRRFLNILFIVCGAFGFIAYASYFIKQLIWHEGTLPFCSAVAGMLVAGLPLFLKKVWERIIPEKVFFVLENIFAWGMCFYTVTFLSLCIYITGAGTMQVQAEDLPEETVFVVYGAGLRGENPGSVLKKRLNKTAELMEELPDSVCVVSGGQGANEVISEALAMKTYLVKEKGISEDRIFMEDQARNTIQNVKFSLKILEQEDLSEYRMVSVSNAFHIPRIKLICARLDCDGAFVLAKDPNPYALYPTLVREYMSYVKLFLFGAE